MLLAATQELGEACHRTWDVITVGAGPAGAMASHELARRGVSVLLVDQAFFPRRKVCGACLNAWSLATLADAGLGYLAEARGAVPLGGIRLSGWGRQLFVPLVGSFALSREALDADLVAAAVSAGASFLPGTIARLGENRGDTREVYLRQADRQEQAAARVVIAADGLVGTFTAATGVPRVVAAGSRLGAGTVVESSADAYPAGIVHMACGTDGYVGLVRLEDGRLNVAGAFDPAAVRGRGLGAVAAWILEEADLPPVPQLADLSWQGTPRLTRRVARPADERLFLIGDAAGYVEPFTGEGIAWALASGVAIAPLARQACRRWQRTLSAQWSALHQRTVTRRQWVCRMLAGLLRRPTLACHVATALNWAPALFAPLLRFLVAPVPRLRRQAAAGKQRGSP